MKNKRTWGKIIERAVRGSAHGKNSIGDSVLNQFISLRLSVGLTILQHCTNKDAESAMGTLDNSITLRVERCDGFRMDTGFMKHVLEFKAHEFGAAVVYTDCRTRVSTEPCASKGFGDMLGGTVAKRNNFDKIRDWVDHGEEVKGDRDTSTIKGFGPRTWISRHRDKGAVRGAY